jgi:hypothetical protein
MRHQPAAIDFPVGYPAAPRRTAAAVGYGRMNGVGWRQADIRSLVITDARKAPPPGG